jgi:RNA polymerase sigma-70 factor (ECF subfamily)
MTASDAWTGTALGRPVRAGAPLRPRRPAVAAAGDAAARDTDLTCDLERARGGDELAFARVFRAVQPGLLRYLTALVGNEADDVASETWAQVCRDLATFRGDIDGFRAWVATIARHRALDYHRARGRRPVNTLPVEELHGVPGKGSTEDLALESMSTEAAVAAIASLPKDQAEAVLLRAVMGLDAKSAGRVLGKRAGAVRTAAYRGLQTLAERTDRDEQS